MAGRTPGGADGAVLVRDRPAGKGGELMGVQVRRNFSLKTIALTTKADMEAIGRLARERIIRRTVMGQLPGGQPMPPYSAGYAKQKAAELGSASPVNLSVSGEMLRSIQVIAEEKKVTLTFTA